MASKGYVNKETRILADNVNAPHIFDEGGVTDTVSNYIVDIIDDHKEEIASIIGGGVNYSLEEQDTHCKWIDGKSIYQKTLIIDTQLHAAGGADWAVAHNIPNIDKVIKYDAIFGYSITPYNKTYEGNNWHYCINNVGQTEIHMSFGKNFSASDTPPLIITMYYTKTTD